MSARQDTSSDTAVDTTTAEILSSAQEQEFRDRGFLVVNFDLDADLLERIKTRVYPYYPEEFRQNPALSTRLQDIWLTVDEVRQLAVNPQILGALQQLFGRTPLPFQTLNFPVGTAQLAHSDTIHFNSIPSGYMAGVWVALEDMDETNGPLIYYPGSHRLPEYSMQDFGLGNGYEYYKDYERCVQNLIREQGLEPHYGLLRKGEALIWHANLLHGGAPRRDPARTRHSQVTHYFFEGCRYCTPMMSSEDSIHFRDPIWIPRSAAAVPRLRRRLSPGLPGRILRKLGF